MTTRVNTGAIGRELGSVEQMQPDHLMTGWFSSLDYHVLKLLDVYPQLRTAHSNFAQARGGIWPNQLTDESWKAMKRAAAELAAAVCELGDIDIYLCEQSTKYGTCGHALTADGQCLMDWHVDPSSAESPLPD
jgi:hypothetical protein